MGAASPAREASSNRRPRALLLFAAGGPIWRLRGFIGRHLSVRAKLTIWYGAMCGLTLALAGTGMYVYVQHSLDGEIDQKLAQTATAAAADITHELASLTPAKLKRATSSGLHVSDCNNRTRGEEGLPPNLFAYCNVILEVLDRDSARFSAPGQFEQVRLAPTNGTTYTQGPIAITASGHELTGLENIDIPTYYAHLLGAAQAGRTSYLSGSFRSTPLREYFAPLRLPPALSGEGIIAALEVFQNRTTYDSIQRTLLLTLLLGAPLGLLLALLAGWWIARAALRPINRISRTVRAIGESRDLSRRLHFVGPEDEVGRLATTFDGMMERLERVFETQKRFIADASHELRTPLTAIRGNADLMRIAPPEDREACLAAIRRESERMTRLVSDLLLLAEADVAEQQLQVSPVDLDEVVTDVFRSAQVISGGRVEVVLERADAVCVDGDADRLKQLLLNLVDNAVKFTPEGGTVSLALWRDGESACIAVSDSGVGIPPEEQAAIFERFYRVEESRSKRGSGLGLAICAWVARAHHGTINVSSQPGKGSTFTVRLPVATSHVGSTSTHAAE